MNRAKLLVTNMLVYGFGGVISKAIPLIMVPIITRLMPNSFYYGLSDLTSTIISLFSALAVMGMYDAMFRMFFEKKDEEYKKDICSSALFFTVVMSLIVALIMICLNNQISALFLSDSKYGNLVMLCAASVMIGATNSIISAPTRMQNQRLIFLITNTLSPIISYSIAIPLILLGYYIIAIPLSSLISVAIIEISFYFLNHKWFSFKRINWHYIKLMLMIAIPLLPNFIIYWIFNSSDRVMINNILGTEFSGIYAVSAKIGQISQLIYTAFAGGWQYFAFSIMRDDDNVDIISKIFELLAAISFITTILGTSICKIGIEILFTEEYWSCYICIPYLYLAPLLLMLFQIGTNQFLVIKKTWPNIIILGSGAIINILLNLILIPKIGIEGASIATFAGYFISILLCLIILIKIKLIKLSWKFYTSTLLFILVFIIMRFNHFTQYFINIPLAIVFSLLVFFMYKNEIFIGLKKLFKNKNRLEMNNDSASINEKF